MKKRVIIVVLDSVGIGNAPDAAAYGDAGTNTLVNMSKVVAGGLNIPTLQKMGLGNILPNEILGCPAVAAPLASFGRMIEKSAGKDTTIGHWEMAGIITPEKLPTFPAGFDQEFLQNWALEVGVEGWLGNKTASGTVIIKELGELHVKSGLPIVYTSADSVFQIAAHEKYFGLEKLYDICDKTRKMLDPIKVGRVIARPFIGENAGDFTRTSNRHDYSLKPFEPNMLTAIKAAGKTVQGVGKINDIFAGSGITDTVRTVSNQDGMDKLIECLEQVESGLIFVNLVEFDMIYGHRRNPQGYAKCLAEFDQRLAQLLPKLRPNDILMMTADHGLDPTYKGTDHTREMVPIISYSASLPVHNLGTRKTFADIAATTCKVLGVEYDMAGATWL